MIECIDLFCGAGGLSLGLEQAGLRVRLAVDQDQDCEKTYRHNFPNSKFIRKDLNALKVEELLVHLETPSKLVLAGGPPCQLFSRLNRTPRHKSKEISTYVRIVRGLQPDYVVFENVPAIVNQKSVWNFLLRSIKRLKYTVRYGVISVLDFGVPQKRKRMIVVASKNGIELPVGNCAPISVRDAIGHLPEVADQIPNHKSMKLSDKNLKTIMKLKAGGCSRKGSESFSDSYARMAWDDPAPTITTKCISFSNGRFGHPEFDRALTIREAATLQGFPETFRFFGNLWSCARQVGNAVPPPVGKALGLNIIRSNQNASLVRG